MKLLIKLLVVAAFTSIFSLTKALALECKGESWTPNSRYKINGGEVYDTRTKLTWKRCPEGTVYSSEHCSGTATSFDALAALAHFPARGDGWRLPSVYELASLRSGNNYDNQYQSWYSSGVTGGCFDPAINTAVFPNYSMRKSEYGRVIWTSSNFLGKYDSGAIRISVYGVNFSVGEVFAEFEWDVPRVLLVKGAQYIGGSVKIKKHDDLSYLELKKRYSSREIENPQENNSLSYSKTGYIPDTTQYSDITGMGTTVLSCKSGNNTQQAFVTEWTSVSIGVTYYTPGKGNWRGATVNSFDEAARAACRRALGF